MDPVRSRSVYRDVKTKLLRDVGLRGGVLFAILAVAALGAVQALAIFLTT